MKSGKNEAWKFEKLYGELKRFYDTRYIELENAIMDHELMKDDWTIHFVVDYCQVLLFAFPLGLERISFPDEKERSRVATMQAARAFVFYGLEHCPQPVLIPPYATELRNWLSIILSKSQESALKIDAIQNWGRSLLSEEERKLIDKANEWYKLPSEERKLLPELTSQMIALVNKKFLDMYFLISGAMVKGIRIMRSMYRGEKPCLQMAYRRWKNYDEMTKNVKKGYSSSWYSLFSKIRSGRTIPNINDALAIEIVMALNDNLMKNKEIVLLISDAETMNLALNEKIEGKPRGSVVHPKTGKEIPILRTSDTFLTYMTSVEKKLDIEGALERLYHEKRESADFYAIEAMIKRASEICEDVSENIQGDCSECPNRKSCSEISRKLEKHKEKINEISTLRYFLNRFDFLGPYLNFLDSNKSIDKNIEKIVKFLGEKNEKFEGRLRDKIKELEQEINELIDAIEDPSIELAPQDAIEFLAYRLKRLNGIPYRIIFRNPRINDAIHDLFRSTDEGKIKEIRENAKRIFNLTHDPSLGNEGKLLLSSLLYCFRHYEMVRDITLLMLSKDDLSERKEFVLLKCLSYGRLSMETQPSFYYNKAYKECSEAVKRYSDDPRFHNMLGVIIARGIESGLEGTKRIDDVIKWFQDALKLCSAKDNMLIASMENNIAYLITQKTDHTLEELGYANDLLNEMEKLWHREKWAADFWDTDGSVQLEIAELTDDFSKKKIFLEKAIEKLQKAERIGEKHRIRQSDLDLIRERLDIAIQRLKCLQ